MPLKKKDLLYGLGALCVAGLLFWLIQLQGYKKVRDWFRPVEIDAISNPRDATDKFIAGETVTFSLKNVQSEKVFWLFDEKDFRVASIEIAYAFQYDDSKKEGIEVDHRIDAFYKHRGSYRTTSRFVRIENIKYKVRLEIGGLKIVLRSASILPPNWVLAGASLSRFERGAFKPKLHLAIEPKSGAKTTKTVISREAFAQVFGIPEDADLKTRLAIAKDAWVRYEFTERDGDKKLAIVKPLFMVLK